VALARGKRIAKAIARAGLDTFVPQRPFAYAYATLLDSMGVERGPLGRYLSTGLVRPSREEARRQGAELHTRLKEIEVIRDKTGSRALAVEEIANGADVTSALVQSVREILKAGNRNFARAVAQSLRGKPGFEQVGDITSAMVLMADSLPKTAWHTFRRYDASTVLLLAPIEYLKAGFSFEPVAAAADLKSLIDAGDPTVSDTDGWLQLAGLALIAREEDLAERSIGMAEQVVSPDDRETIHAEIEWMRSWLGRMERARTDSKPGSISFGIVDYKQPDFGKSSKNLGDHIQTVAALGHLVRHQSFTFSGDTGLVSLAKKLQKNVRDDRRRDDLKADFSLSLVQRDGSEFHDVPEQTWMLAFGWYKHPTFGEVRSLHFHENIRPIFVSVHIDVPGMLTEESIAYLKKYAPVGCRDWNTVHLLLAAGVPAFFSGCITTTVDTVFPAETGGARKGTLVVDARVPDEGDRFEQRFLDVRLRPFLENMDHALEILEMYRAKYARVITSRLHSYLPARSLGATVDFRPENPSDSRFDGLAGISDEAFDSIRQGYLHKLEQVFSVIASGAPEDEVYATWRELCAPDVEAAMERHTNVPPIPAPTFDVEETCEKIRAARVDVERSEYPHDGAEINIEMSLDGNLKHQLQVTIQSLVDTSSRPLHLWILSRDHGPEDFERLGALFPQVSFTWLPCDGVEYGDIVGMISHITIATMDRLLLPSLLPELDRVIHFDIDAIARADIAPLADIPLGDFPIAARLSPQPDARSGFATIISAAGRLKKRDKMSRELILRSHNAHAFDFESFNAGIMVLNLERMRADDFCRNYIPYAERYGLHDQEILNQYAGGKIVRLEREWNTIPRFEAVDDASVIHWAGANKPWGEQYVAGREFYRQIERKLAARLAGVGY
jgi:lipopolysaccharide biosynthesis glycosyltransferase